MKKINAAKKILIFTVLALHTFLLFSLPLYADSYSTGFSNGNTVITSPAENNIKCAGHLSVEGVSELGTVWFCLRGPNGEITTEQADVSGGRFKRAIQLRFGPGTYTIWAGDNPGRFDGIIRFQVVNELEQDTRYISPSAYVDSNSELVHTIVGELIKPGMNEMEKLTAIHDWVTNNIEYDYEAYLAGSSRLVPASETLASKKGVCGDYAFVVAALSRAAGLQARVIFGQAVSEDMWEPQDHAWNEVLADGRWVAVDTAWDAGHFRDGSFVKAPSLKYFNPEASVFAMSHQASNITLY